VERGVRFVQLFDWGWDSHGAADSEALNTEQGFQRKCREIDQATAALLVDLKQRGLLDDTLVVWGGEFGRTPMRENRGGKEMAFVGRDHHPEAFTIWLAGAGVKPGFSYGETDPIGYSATTEPVEVRDFHATLLHLLGLDHRRLVFPYRGLDEKLTGVKEARVVGEILA
jgi:arylsulfatase A-like enzyme